MKAPKFKGIIILFIISFITIHSYSQHSNKGWFSLPGFIPENPITSGKPNYIIGTMGLAAFSAILSELILKKQSRLYYTSRLGMNNEYFWGLRKVYLQNLGIEKRFAPWFASSIEFNLQEWTDKTPHIKNKNEIGFGFGLVTYNRWYLLGKKRISPYLEYGIGVFYGIKKFPYNGSNFTFNHSAQLGIEYTFKNKNKLRIGYGQFKQSNFDYYKYNPEFEANGFSFSYLYFLK